MLSDDVSSSAPAPSSFEASLRALRLEQKNVALPGLIATWLTLPIIIIVAALADQWGVYVLVFIPIGLLQYRITLSGHEAVHKTLCFPLWLNEAFGVAGQSIVGVNFASYRVQHLDHHRATSVADDPDGHIYGGIIRAPRGWRRWSVYVFGTFVEIAVKVYQKGLGSIGTRHTDSARVATVPDSKRHTIYLLFAQLALLGGLGWLTGHWWGYFALWIGPLFVVAVFLNRSRILVEHGLALLDGDNAVTRSIPTLDMDPHPIERWIFAPFLFNHHCCHHLFLTVPHYNLPRLRNLLREHRTPGFHEHRGSYLRAIAATMRT